MTMATVMSPTPATRVRPPLPALGVGSDVSTKAPVVPSGIAPLDAREGGLTPGGSYLIVGPPGPSKMVAALQFLHQGVARGEPGLLVTHADAAGILEVACAWGFDMVDAWRDGLLQVVGFRDDFELRAMRSIAPEEVVEELDALAGREIARIAIDPGTMFLAGGAKTLLGGAFARWASRHPATVVSTFSVDGPAAVLPSSADWLHHVTTGRLLIEKGPRGFVQLTLARPLPGTVREDAVITLELKPGGGLVEPTSYPGRRGADRGKVDTRKLLVLSLGARQSADLESWANRSFDPDMVSDPFDAVTRLQFADAYGGVLVQASRDRIRSAIKACRALRPLTRAPIVFASDDSIRSTDRIQILEAGADDCLSGGLDFRELDLRIRQAIATGAKPPRDVGPSETPSSAPAAFDARCVSPAVLAEEVERRASDPNLEFFCLLEVTAALELDQLVDTLVGQVRHEEGDLVSAGDHGCLVLLQGARASQLEPFLRRVRTGIERRTGTVGSDVGIEVLSHPTDRSRIRMLTGTTDGAER